ncbi:MAG TPA: VCBS repeat-containing protein [Polyangiaceae bacterium]|nr:VCBS repeat-containing protein [Polyangiaceae bacterium]
MSRGTDARKRHLRRWQLASAWLFAVACACERHPAAKLGTVSAAGAASAAEAGPPPLKLASASVAPKAVAPSPDPAICTQLLAEQRGLAAKWPEPRHVPPTLGHCYATRSGAWLVYFESVRVATESPGVSARLSVLHLSPAPGTAGGLKQVNAPFIASPFSGKPGAPTLPAGANYVWQEGDYYTNVLAPTLFDYDGDGEAELLFKMDAYVSEGTVSGSVGRVLTFKAGTVRNYTPEPGLNWSNVEDIDHDGRPDLLGAYGTVTVAAHSLADGSFSTVDAAAQAVARRACPPDRKAVFLSATAETPLPEGYGPSGWNGACARLWGASAEAVLREIDRHCAATDCTSKSVVNDAVVESAVTFRRDARLPPPLLLSEPRP